MGVVFTPSFRLYGVDGGDGDDGVSEYMLLVMFGENDGKERKGKDGVRWSCLL